MYNDILVHKADYNYGCIRNIGGDLWYLYISILYLPLLSVKFTENHRYFQGREERKSISRQYLRLWTDQEICHEIYLKTHMTRDQVPFSCSKCDYVSLTLKDVENDEKWYGPHKYTDLPVDIIRAAKPFVWKDYHLRRWDQPSQLAHWEPTEEKWWKEYPELIRRGCQTSKYSEHGANREHRHCGARTS